MRTEYGGDSIAGQEKLLENRIKRFLESKGIYRLGTPKQKKIIRQIGFYWKNHEGSMFDTIKGRPDIVVFIKNKYVFIEVKATHGKPSIHQIRILNEINSVGGIGVLCYPKDFEDTCKLIEEVINE